AIQNDSIRYGSDDPALANAWAELADTYLTEGRHLEALPHAERALALVASRKRGSPDRLRPLMVAGYARRTLRQFDDAEPLLQEVVKTVEDKCGADHRRLADAIGGLENLRLMKGERAEARRDLQRILQIRERAFGKDHPAVAYTLTSIATTFD